MGKQDGKTEGVSRLQKLSVQDRKERREMINRDCTDAEIKLAYEEAEDRREKLATPGFFPKLATVAEMPEHVRAEMSVDAAIAARHGIDEDGEYPTRINHHQAISEEAFYRAKDERAAKNRNSIKD